MSWWHRNSGADWIHRPTRLAIYDRDGWCCLFCGDKRRQEAANGLSLDHVVPRSRDGKASAGNLLTVCIPCNSSRRDRPIDLWARDAGLDTSEVMRRIYIQLRKRIDPERGRALCEKIYPGWLAKQAARKRAPGGPASTDFNFGAAAR